MTKRALLSVLVAIISFSAFSPVSLAVRQERTLVNGVNYISDTTASGHPIRILVVNPRVALVSMDGPGDGSSCTLAYTNTDFQNLNNERDFVGAINGLFTDNTGQISGDYLGNRVYFGNNQSLSNLSIDHSGVIHLGAGATAEANTLTPATVQNYSMFMHGGYRIDNNGVALDRMTAEDINTRFHGIYSRSEGDASGEISRTMIGVNVSENKLILLTSGDGAMRTNGITPVDAVRYMVSLGATAGFNMDSGGSTIMRISPRLGVSDVQLIPKSDHHIQQIVTVRARGPRSDAEVNALPKKDCSSDHHGATVAGTNPPPTTDNASQPAPSSSNPTNPQPVTANQPVVSNVNVAAGAVALEVPIGDITSINPDGGLITNYAKTLFGYATGLVGLIAMIMLIVSGFQIMVVGGEGIKAAQERIVGVIAGLVLLATGGFVLYLVNPCFFNFTNSNACVARINTGSTQPPPLSVGGGSTGGGNGLSTGDNSQPTAAQPNRPRTPTQYANEKLSEAQSRWQQYGNDFNRAASIMFDGAPGEVFMGFASNGGITELTPGGSFRALGMFGVETGPGPAPAPVAGGPDRWFPLSTDAQVQQFLGRPATTAPDAWKTAIPDQIAVGYANLRDHGIRVMNSMPANIRTTNHGSPWFVAMAAMGWSAGDGTAANIVAPFADRLASVSDQDRWGTFVKLMAEAGANGTIAPRANTSGHFDSHGAGDTAAGRYDTHDNPFYSVVKTMQKLEAGYTLAQRNNSPNLAFFGYPSGVDRSTVQQTMTNLGYYGVATR